MLIPTLKDRVLAGGAITRDEALALWEAPLAPLCQAADAIRAACCGERVDLCAIINGKSGRCSENCRFCAQSSHYRTGAEVYDLLDTDTILAAARRHADQGVRRFSIVTAGRALSDADIDRACRSIRAIRQATGLSVCVSFGLLTRPQYEKLRAAGVSRVHNNLETSEAYFPEVCTTHTFADKVAAIRAAQAAGLSVCSGGILGLGEGAGDRIDLAFALKALDIRSVPVNFLNPIAGTPMADRPVLAEAELRRTIAVFRFILPDALIRLAGGRGLLEDKGRACFQAGANAVITGDMLTTAGYTVASDKAMLVALGREV